MKTGLPLVAMTFMLSAGGAQAVLLASFVETFSGGGGGSANTSVYILSSTTVSSFTLQNSAADGSFLDSASDGYALLSRTSGSSATNAIAGSYGVVELADVGKIVSIDAGFRHTEGLSAVWSIRLDGTDVGVSNSQSYLIVGSFGGQDISNNTDTLLSNVPATHGDTGRTPGPLTYTIQAGDVGKELGLRVGVFDSTGSRDLLLDSISYSVIPEPSTALLAGLGLLGLLRRRR